MWIFIQKAKCKLLKRLAALVFEKYNKITSMSNIKNIFARQCFLLSKVIKDKPYSKS